MTAIGRCCCTIPISANVKIGDALNWSRLATIRTIALVLAGLAGIALGAFLMYQPAGWIVLGISLVLVAYLTDNADPRRP